MRVLLILSSILGSINAGACKPVTILMTRASGSEATFSEGKWSTRFGLSTVNTASMAASLKFIITETIDKNAGYAECERKNGVAYIHFYSMQVCNPDAALWWFNQREAGYGGDPEAYNFGEFGQYLTMDSGACHGSIFCDYLGGTNNAPKLGQFIGWQDVSTDDRNPTSLAYWYSLPGECPTSEWSSKSDECIAAYPTGACAEGVTPDGETCTWSYTLLGQVPLDDLVGITDIDNPATGAKFTNATEYCKAGNVEFERDPATFDFVSGLPFWEAPLDPARNAQRIEELIAKYATYPNNLPLPNVDEINAANPRCFESVPGCYDEANNAETCTRNSQSLCVPCDQVTGGCAAASGDAFPNLEPVPVLEPLTDSSPAPGPSPTPGSGDNSFAPTMHISIAAMVLSMTLHSVLSFQLL